MGNVTQTIRKEMWLKKDKDAFAVHHTTNRQTDVFAHQKPALIR